MPPGRAALLLLALAPALRAADPPPPSPTDTLTRPAVPTLPPPGAIPRPAYAPAEPLPIDLPTVLRLVNANSPVIGFAQARVREALARQELAEVQWLPDLAAGLNYYRLDGQTQNQRGEIFGVSRSNLFAGGGPALRLDTADAVYDRLVARRLTAAERFRAGSTTITAQLDAVLAYLDLVEVYGRLAVNADILDKAETMLKFARNAQEAQLSKTAADVNRALTEVYYRWQERIELRGQAAAASARLARLLLLQPTVELRPADSAVVPVVLVNGDCTLDDLVGIALRSRPDLAAFRNLVAAADQRVKKARNGPLFPTVVLDQRTGTFGGGVNDFVGRFSSRSELNLSAYWQLQNLGFGDAAQTRAQRALWEQAVFQLSEAQARAAAEVTEAAAAAAARYDELDLARAAVAEASETYRKLRETSFNMVGPRGQYDALEPLVAIQQLNQARLQYLTAVIEFDRAQFRLYAALGQPIDPTPPPAHP